METVGKVNRRFASVLAVMSVLTLTAPVFAADADFNGEGASPVWAYDTLSVRAYGYDAFGDATKDLAPGAIRSLSVRLRNNTADTVEFRLAADPLTGARAEALETGFPGKTADDSLLDAIGITVRHGAAQLYVGTLRGLAADGDAALYGNAGVSLGLVSGGYSGLIEVTLSVPSSLPSSAMDTLCAVSWRFAATQYNDPPPKPQEPDNPPGAQSPPDPQSPAGQSAPPDAGAAQTQGAPPILDDTPAAELPDADVPASPGSPDVNVEAELKDGAVPAASGGRAWSLVNLALTCVAALLLVLSPARYFLAAIGRRGGEEDASPGGTEDPRAEAAGRAAARRARRGRALLAGILSTVVTILLFLLTEDMRLPMEWVNKYTVVYAAAVAAELFFALSAKRRPKARPAE